MTSILAGLTNCDTVLLRERIESVVAKTIVAMQTTMVNLCRNKSKRGANLKCF